MTVAVVVDGAAALPPEVVERYGIAVVPLQLRVGADSYADGELPLEDVMARSDEGVSTSAPAPGAWLAALEGCDRADEAVFVTVAGTLSASHDAALLAQRLCGADVRVVDSGTAAGAEGLVALAAADAAARGRSLDDCARAATHVAARVHLMATVDDLDQLAASGRVPNLAAWAGNRLHVNPIFEFVDGEARPLRPALSRAAALERIVDRCRETRPPAPVRLCAVGLHADATTDADQLLRAVLTSEADLAFRGEFSAAMVAHTGRGVVGLAWWWDDGALNGEPATR